MLFCPNLQRVIIFHFWINPDTFDFAYPFNKRIIPNIHHSLAHFHMREVQFVVHGLDKKLAIPSVFHAFNYFGEMHGVLGHLHPALDVNLNPDNPLAESVVGQKDAELSLQRVDKRKSLENIVLSFEQFVVITNFLKGFELIVPQKSYENLVFELGHD